MLVLSNSLGTDFGMWDKQVEALTKHHRVLRYDTRGQGASETTPGDHAIELFGRDVLALADELSIGRFAFCGLSLGGLVGQWLGIHAPTRLTRLIICNTAPHLPPAENWTARMATARRDGMAALVEPVMQRFFSDAYRGRDEPFYRTIRSTFLATDPEGYAGCCAAIRDADFRRDVVAIALPTLVIGGNLDAATPPSMGAEALANLIKGSTLSILTAGHVSNVELPKAFIDVVDQFLRQSE